jgi:murein DD-endopeptidase MepM/ murein hydrolase activator NlpD
MIIAWYIVLTFAFDTPSEYRLRHSTDNLKGEYDKLSQEYDELDKVLVNVTERDVNVFRKLFETNPYDLGSADNRKQYELYEELITLTPEELLERYAQDLDKTEKYIKDLNKSHEQLLEVIDNNTLVYNNIPAIQPINNRQLTLLAAGKKPLINPFHRIEQEHHGIDYLISEGTPVYATADGVIESIAEKNSSHGKSITIDHGNGYKTSYSHLSDIQVKKGNKVKRGDIIAHSGNSGLSFAPHLHYEVILNGNRVDPIHYFFMELTPEEYKRIKQIAISSMQSFD